MKLLLTSEGIANDSIAKALFELVGKPFTACRVAYVPTAGYDEPGDKTWIEMDMDTIRKLKPQSFTIVDIASEPKNVWLPIFQKSDVIAVGGGNVSFLLQWLEKSGVKKELPELLKTRVYIGFSAGSMVTAKIVSLSKEDIENYQTKGEVNNKRGLGYVDFQIRPHLNHPDFPRVNTQNLAKLASKISTSFYAIDNDTAIKVDGDRVTVVSEGEWKKFN